MAVVLEFMECDTCRAKSGTPTLCDGCQHNRYVIAELEAALEIANQRHRRTFQRRKQTHERLLKWGTPQDFREGKT